MLKGRWRLIGRRCEVRRHNVKYVVMLCSLLHNMCIAWKDPCKPRWRAKVKTIEFKEKSFARQESKAESIAVSRKIANWLWEHKLT